MSPACGRKPAQVSHTAPVSPSLGGFAWLFVTSSAHVLLPSQCWALSSSLCRTGTPCVPVSSPRTSCCHLCLNQRAPHLLHGVTLTHSSGISSDVCLLGGASPELQEQTVPRRLRPRHLPGSSVAALTSSRARAASAHHCSRSSPNGPSHGRTQKGSQGLHRSRESHTFPPGYLPGALWRPVSLDWPFGQVGLWKFVFPELIVCPGI